MGIYNLKTVRIALIGVTLPFFPIGVSAVLVLVSFINPVINAIIAVDKLILLTAVLSPAVYISGAIISVTALFKSKKKTVAGIGLALNILMLIIQLYFSKSVLMEFEFII